MSIYRELKNELKEKNKLEKLTKGNRILLEQAIFKDLSMSGKCVRCGKTENLSLDHIVPIYILQFFGIDTDREIIEDNYQIMCRGCNHFKAGRLDFANPKTKEILLKLLEKL